MKKHKRGFTLIEVTLFLGLTAALFVGIAAGVANSIFHQRYTDAVQNYAEFLRSIYSQVSNVQNENTGRSDKAIYGKVITFRATDTADNKTRGNEIKTYNLIGDVERVQVNGAIGTGQTDSGETVCASGGGDGSVVWRLRCLRANVMIEKVNEFGMATGQFQPVGFVENYQPRWSSEVQTTDSWENGYEIFEGIMIVTHSPSSGNISTYLWTGNGETVDGSDDNITTQEIRKVIDKIEACSTGDAGGCSDGDIFRTGSGYSDSETYMDRNHFKARDIDFCINPRGYEPSGIRRDIRVVKGAHNASGVNVLDEDQVSTEVDYSNFDQNRCR